MSERKCDKSQFSWLALLIRYFFIKDLPKVSEQEKKRQRIHDLLNAENQSETISEIISVTL